MTKLKVNLALAVAAAVMAFEPGCVTTADGKKVVDPAVLHAVAEDAAYVGTMFTLQSNPQYRPAFEQARFALQQFVNLNSTNFVDLQAILAQLPVKQLGTNGTVILQGQALILLDSARALVQRLDKNNIGANYVQPIATGLLEGLNLALNGPQASEIKQRLQERAAVQADLNAAWEPEAKPVLSQLPKE